MSRLRRKSWGKVASTAAALALVSSFLMAGGGVASAGETITLYNGQHEQTTDSLVAGFEKATGINVEVRNDDEDKGLLAPVAPKTLAQSPSKYNSSDGDWEGVSARVSVLIYNPKLISKSQLPTTVLGLAAPKYKGKLAFAAGETDFQPIVTSVIKAYGSAKATAWLKGIKANSGSHTYPDNETITDEVNRGAVAFGVINQYYWYRLGSEIGTSNVHSKITYFAPHDPGYVMDVSGAGILKSSKHQAAAQKFLAYLTSKAGQTILAHSISWEYPIASGVTRTGETPFTQLQPNPITITQLGNGAAAIALLQKAGLL
jgi:iron(III) transport system substrate-binding protein